jgi:hypothetical protein
MGQTEISGHCYCVMHKNREGFVINFACVKCCRISILRNLTDMHRKAWAGFGLCVARVPVAYHHSLGRTLTWIPLWSCSRMQSTSSLTTTPAIKCARWSSQHVHPWSTIGPNVCTLAHQQCEWDVKLTGCEENTPLCCLYQSYCGCLV